MLCNFLVCCIVALLPLLHSFKTPVLPDFENLGKHLSSGKTVSPCHACHKLVKSFLKAVEETTRRSFEGGDAAWEKEKLGKYENSELRFIEIQEKVCSDVEQGKEQCYNLAELYESELEEWFHYKRMKNINLLEFLCINHLKICCPANTYGPNCIPCPGGVDIPCDGHGKCKNGGTREEPGTCICDDGYTGNLCDSCKKGYYNDPDSPTLLCKSCDKACKDHCRGPGPKNCEVCSSGYHFIPDKGCVEPLGEVDSLTEFSNQLNDTVETILKNETGETILKNETGETIFKTESKPLEEVPVDNGHSTEHSEL